MLHVLCVSQLMPLAYFVLRACFCCDSKSLWQNCACGVCACLMAPNCM